MNEVSNGSLVLYKMAVSFLLGIVMAGGAAFFANQKDMISRREFNEQNLRFEQHLESNDAQIKAIADLQQKNAMQLGMVIEDMRLGVKPSK